MHEWGDEWFEKYGDTLQDAMNFISLAVHAETGIHPVMKEKYGSIRYEYITEESVSSLHEAIGLAADIYPEIKDEILENSPFEDQYRPYWRTL